jgi:hypothetical protein
MWSSPLVRMAAGPRDVSQLIPRPFNQLLVFDDRLIHGVTSVQGSMDPREGRVVLQGHLRCAPASVSGSLGPAAVAKAIGALAAEACERGAEAGWRGLAVFRFTIAPAGHVSAARLLYHTLRSATANPRRSVGPLLRGLMQRLRTMTFPRRWSGSVLTLPIRVEPRAPRTTAETME